MWPAPNVPGPPALEPGAAGIRTNADAAHVSAGGFGVSPEEVGAKATAETAAARLRLKHGDVVIAAITSCTNTSDPFVMVGAGLLAKKALEKGLMTQPYVKTSLAPGSRVVSEYLNRANLLEPLNHWGLPS